MLGAVFFFTVMDAVAKKLSSDIGLIPTIWARYAGQALLVFLIVLPRISTVAKSEYPKLQVLRSVVLMAATCLFFLSISKIGLAEATAIMDINPVLITLVSLKPPVSGGSSSKHAESRLKKPKRRNGRRGDVT